MSTFVCKTCGEIKQSHSGKLALFGVIPGGHKVCPDCLGRIDASDMTLSGKAALYIEIHDDETATVKNYFGTIQFKANWTLGEHNISGNQIRASFIGPDGAVWSGMQTGFNQVIHCKRNKKQRKDLSTPPESVYFKPFHYEPNQPDPDRAIVDDSSVS